MEYGQGGDALVHSRRDARFALSARAERPHRLSMMEGINAGARSKACLFTGKLLRKEDSSTALWLYCRPMLDVRYTQQSRPRQGPHTSDVAKSGSTHRA